MRLGKQLFLWFLLIVWAFPALSNTCAVTASADDSIVKGASQDESILFNMINDMRRQAKLQPIPFSPDLSKVAHVHIDDLIESKPQDHGCSLHSWSVSAKWSTCCNTKDPAGIQCMKSKPREITGYPGNGYELIYWGEDAATPADAADLWKQVDASSDMILCRNKWKNFQWKALGIAIKDGYAILWLGDKTDKHSEAVVSSVNPTVTPAGSKTKPKTGPSETEVKVIKTEKVAKPAEVVSKEESKGPVASNPEVKYYLIVGSVKTAAAAKPELKRIKSKGYPEAYILEGESVYRIALESFNTNKQASKRLFELKKDFPDIWILKK